MVFAAENPAQEDGALSAFRATHRALTGAALAAIRTAAGLSQEEAARTLAVSASTLSRYERGDTAVPAEFLVRLARLVDPTDEGAAAASVLLTATYQAARTRAVAIVDDGPTTAARWTLRPR